MTKAKTTPEATPKKYKVKFVSTLFTFDFRYTAGDVAELTAEQLEVAKKYNSIEVL